LGNIIDSVFLRSNFDGSQSTCNYFSDQPYGTWFHGQVVDMFYFRSGKEACLHGYVLGGKDFTFNAILICRYGNFNGSGNFNIF
jgi:signal peptidase II